MKRVIIALQVLFLLTIAVGTLVSGLGSGLPFRNPHAFGYGEVRYCRPLTYQITTLDPSYGLTEKQANEAVGRAAKVWNDAAGCTLLAYCPNGELEILFLDPTLAPFPECSGRFYPSTNVLQVFDRNRFTQNELLAHELGHALGLDHVQKGLMQPSNWYCSLGYPCPSEDD
jgi:hypothetical protein